MKSSDYKRLPELKQCELINTRLKSLKKENQSIFFKSHILNNIIAGNVKLPIYSFSIGSMSIDSPSITFIGGIHGLERIGCQLILSFLNGLIQKCYWNSVLLDSLKKVTINFIPMANPAGIYFKRRGNIHNVDLMRNAPIDSKEKTAWLVGGHRISSYLPWYRGKKNVIEIENETIIDYVKKYLFPRPFNLILDCHSGFGLHDRIWFPYAKSKKYPILDIGKLFYLRKMFFLSHPHHNYIFEPQSQHYLCHGDLWDYLYDLSQSSNRIILPLTLEMGSWAWIKKNPLQIFNSLGFFHPIKNHRIKKVINNHNILFNFLIDIVMNYSNWYENSHLPLYRKKAMAKWYK